MFGVVSVSEAVWSTDQRAYVRLLGAAIGVSPRGRSARLERALTDFGCEHSFAHAAALSHQLSVGGAAAALAALLVASYAVELAAPGRTHTGAAWACARSLAARASTYAMYALVQIALARAAVAAFSSLAALAASCAVPLALAALLIALRQWCARRAAASAATATQKAVPAPDALAVIGCDLVDAF